MLKPLSIYFTAEKQESAIFVLVGIVAIAVGAWLWVNGHRLKSMAFPLISIALIQIVVGANVYLRTDTQLAELTQQSVSAPAMFKAAESERMEIVMKNFSVYKLIELALLVIGIVLIAFFQRSDLATGIGAGLVMQSALMLVFDMFAEARGEDYLTAIRQFAG
jgi:hypothetical protein